MKKYRFLTAALATILILATLAGCAARPSEGPGTTASGTQSDTAVILPPLYPETGTDIPDGEDPYAHMSAEEFYRTYTPAKSPADARLRTRHHFMSGSLELPDQAPVTVPNQPLSGNRFIRNNVPRYEDNGNTYVIVDAYGHEVNRIYRGGAYITLEEVAAYLLAFGDVPPNYVEGKTMKPTNNPWGVYLRLNHNPFSGSTYNYPYEPELPRIQGCGGDLYYYEIDLGTTGTDCDPSYPAKPYNSGTKITRGAARLVYTRFDRNRDQIIDINEKFVFYTYNHYNDFQEYLNYQGGWGEMFGNITGGGQLSSRKDYNPTPYVPVVFAGLDGEAAAFLPFSPAEGLVLVCRTCPDALLPCSMRSDSTSERAA